MRLRFFLAMAAVVITAALAARSSHALANADQQHRFAQSGAEQHAAACDTRARPITVASPQHCDGARTSDPSPHTRPALELAVTRVCHVLALSTGRRQRNMADPAAMARNDAFIQAHGGQPSAWCDQVLKARGTNSKANVYKVPDGTGPSPTPVVWRCPGWLTNIVGLDSQLAGWNQPHANRAAFDADWNPVNDTMAAPQC